MDLAVELVLDMDYAVEVAKQKPSLRPADCIRAYCRDDWASICLLDATTRADSTFWWHFVPYG
jgi:hypothetical protein